MMAPPWQDPGGAIFVAVWLWSNCGLTVARADWHMFCPV